MAAINARPIVFPLSNPTSKSECTAERGGALVGRPRDRRHRQPVRAGRRIGGRPHRIGQGNNAFIFPGVGLGLWVGRVRRVTDAMFLDAARGAREPGDASAISPSGAVYPELTRIRDCSHAVACAVIRRAVADGHAAPALLNDVEETVSRAMWIPRYRPIRYEP